MADMQAQSFEESAVQQGKMEVASVDGVPVDPPGVCGKNPAMRLNELRKGLVYDLVSETKEGTETIFTMSVNVDGETFEGSAKNKRLAKQEAAKYALLKIFNILYVPGMEPETPSPHKNRKRKMKTEVDKEGDESMIDLSGPPTLSCKNPVMLLNEMKEGLTYQLESETVDGTDKIFTMSLVVDDEKFEGTAKSKKQAKSEAAMAALLKKCNIKIVAESEMAAEDELLGGDMLGKRRHGSLGPGGKRRKVHGPPVQKNALMQLNELKPGLEFRFVSQTGPVHAPTFIMSVEVNGTLFEGQGSTKKIAKLHAAEKALKSFVQFPNAAEAHKAMGRQIVNDDFTSDNADNTNNECLFNNFAADPSQMAEGVPMMEQNGSSHKQKNRKSAVPSQPDGKNPVMILNELRPGLKYDFVCERGETHSKNFEMSVTVDNETFTGIARNKKMAKARAAQAALTKIFNLEFSHPPGKSPVAPHKQIVGRRPGPGATNILRRVIKFHVKCMQPIPGDVAANVPQDLANLVSRLVLEKFSELTNGFTSQYARRKVLAGIVMTTGEDSSNAQVISVSTGTKCINGEYMSDKGLALNDCHAEIISRRSLLHFLYLQLMKFLPGSEDAANSIFEHREESQGFKLKDNVHFHLYISTAPCGDSRIFSPHETANEPGEGGDRHPNRKARGQLRTKIESGEGTIPVKTTGTIQTWDGILEGERLLTMSCSDKIARWNVLGVQGALLTHFIEPIYFDSLILGSLYHGDHLSRAVFSRVSGIEDIALPYHLNQPYMSGISNPESRQPGKAPNFAVNWCVGDQSLEVINAMTGKREDGQSSRLCKEGLFRKFSQLYGQISSTISQQVAAQPKMYSEAKEMAMDYQLTKQQLYKAFQKAGLGSWVKKPIEQDQFTLPTDSS